MMLLWLSGFIFFSRTSDILSIASIVDMRSLILFLLLFSVGVFFTVNRKITSCQKCTHARVVIYRVFLARWCIISGTIASFLLFMESCFNPIRNVHPIDDDFSMSSAPFVIYLPTFGYSLFPLFYGLIFYGLVYCLPDGFSSLGKIQLGGLRIIFENEDSNINETPSIDLRNKTPKAEPEGAATTADKNSGNETAPKEPEK